MKIVIVTGLSGAGRSSVMRILEDDGFFCVDNLPVSLLPTFLQLTSDSSEQITKVALGLDVRSGSKALGEVGNMLDGLKKDGYKLEVLFLDAKTEVLVKRYKETRRMHPLNDGGSLDKVIELERELLLDLKQRADYLIDTSTLLIRELKQEIDRIFLTDDKFCNFYLTFVSFGFKYGIPTDADLVFDVRFLPNPFYVEELKVLSGNDKPVYDYVMGEKSAREFLEKLVDMLSFLVPKYIAEGKTQLVVAIGCTGGKHRSVTLTNAVFSEITKKVFLDSEFGCRKEHRDIDKDRLGGANVVRVQGKK